MQVHLGTANSKSLHSTVFITRQVISTQQPQVIVNVFDVQNFQDDCGSQGIRQAVELLCHVDYILSSGFSLVMICTSNTIQEKIVIPQSQGKAVNVRLLLYLSCKTK